MTTNSIITTIACAMLVLGALRVAAPRVSRRWPNSWLDQTVAFILRFGSDWLGAMISIALRQGSAGALVPTGDEAATAKKAYDAYAATVGTTYRGDPMKAWEDLPPETQAGWVAIVKVVHMGQKLTIAIGVIFLSASLSACRLSPAQTAGIAKWAPPIAGATCHLVAELFDSDAVRYACTKAEETGIVPQSTDPSSPPVPREKIFDIPSEHRLEFESVNRVE